MGISVIVLNGMMFYKLEFMLLQRLYKGYEGEGKRIRDRNCSIAYPRDIFLREFGPYLCRKAWSQKKLTADNIFLCGLKAVWKKKTKTKVNKWN